MSQVFLFGTFDGLHEGHRHMLRQAQAHGEVVVCLPPDATVERLKGRAPQYSWEERRQALETSGLVASVALGDSTEGGYTALRVWWPEVVAFGYDQQGLRENFLDWCKKTGYTCRIVDLLPFEEHIYKTSLLRTSSV